MTRRTLAADVLVAGLLVGTTHCRTAPEKSTKITPSTQRDTQSYTTGLGGTSWRLGQFQGGDGLTLKPDDKTKHTIAFGTDGRLSARIDCIRGTWKSAGPPQLEFGPLALTRAMCPPGSLQDGQLFVSLTADGCIYEFEPAP